MNRFFVFLLFLVCLYSSAFSQTKLKWNGAYWAFGITNMSVETRLSKKFTFNGDLVFSPWESIAGNPFLFGMVIPEVRFYPKDAFNGFYLGGFGAFQLFRMSKWNYINTGKYQKGRGFTLGMSVGYELRINDRWSLDMFFGGGWQNSQYRGYHTATGEQYVGWNGSGEWLPYKIGLSFAYTLGR